MTQRQLNRALLARQMLLRRADLRIPAALERMGGLQAQYAPAMYIGLWSRLEGLRREQVTAALEARTVVQATLMRSTIHVVSRADYWPLAAATREALQALWLKAWRQPSADEVVAGAAKVRGQLAERSPQSRRELQGSLSSATWYGVGLWLNLVRVPPSGTWERRRADLFANAEDWIGPAPELSQKAAVDHLVRRYLMGFGPATAVEIANWAGLRTAAAVLPSLSRMRLARFTAENGDQLVDLPASPRPPADSPAPVRFLPVWDALLLAHTRRARVLLEEDRPRVFNSRTPHSLNTYLVDGQVAGTWAHGKSGVAIAPFRAHDRPTRRLVEEEAHRIAAFHDQGFAPTRRPRSGAGPRAGRRREGPAAAPG
jgi:hypothetical protein